VQILRVFSDSTGKVEELKGDLENARMLLGARHKQLQQQWSRSVTLRHVISLLDQIDKVAQVRNTELLMGGRFFFFLFPFFSFHLKKHNLQMFLLQRISLPGMEKIAQ
jgi:hypothetical protein